MGSRKIDRVVDDASIWPQLPSRTENDANLYGSSVGSQDFENIGDMDPSMRPSHPLHLTPRVGQWGIDRDHLRRAVVVSFTMHDRLAAQVSRDPVWANT
jgi:hypothetical protein